VGSIVTCVVVFVVVFLLLAAMRPPFVMDSDVAVVTADAPACPQEAQFSPVKAATGAAVVTAIAGVAIGVTYVVTEKKKTLK
jgi:hypothetical protein